MSRSSLSMQGRVRIDPASARSRRLKETRSRYLKALSSILDLHPDAADLDTEAMQATLLLNGWMELVREVSLSLGPIHTATLNKVVELFIDSINADIEIRPEKPS